MIIESEPESFSKNVKITCVRSNLPASTTLRHTLVGWSDDVDCCKWEKASQYTHPWHKCTHRFGVLSAQLEWISAFLSLVWHRWFYWLMTFLAPLYTSVCAEMQKVGFQSRLSSSNSLGSWISVAASNIRGRSECEKKKKSRAGLAVNNCHISDSWFLQFASCRFKTTAWIRSNFRWLIIFVWRALARGAVAISGEF